MMGKEAENSKDRKPPAGEGAAAPARRFVRYCLVLLLAGATVLAWLSVLSFSPTDAPAQVVYPPPPVQNIGGAVGAHLAHVLLYWLGEGAYMLLLFATVSAAVMLLGGRITDVPWRIAGLVLMIASTSAAAHVLAPESAGGLLEGKGGILGISAGRFLLKYFAPTGSYLVLAVTFGVSVMLTADRLVLQVPGRIRRLWRRRGEGRSGASARPARRAPAPAAGTAAPAAPPAPAVSTPPAAKARSAKPTAAGKYQLPSLDLLADPAGGYLEGQEALAEENRAILQQALDDFGVDAEVVAFMTGPVISLFELALAPGVKVSQISSLAPDMARALAVPGVRVVSPLPGRDTVGIEVPNLDKEIVRLKELMTLAPEAVDELNIPLFLGKNAAGKPIVADLASMPHLLLAGTTGSGKSVCINSIIATMLLTRSPEDVRLILIDPKMVEMAAFEKIPHLLCPILNDMRRVEDILEWAATRMDERYELLREAGVRNIVEYNGLGAAELYRRLEATSEQDKAQIATRMPYHVIIIDELADLIMSYGKDTEGYIIRIAQKARAVGIHLILATQRPSVNVVTGLIKSNMPCRISFRVASRQESRIVLDQNGAEVLLGRGDMLFLQPGTSHLSRAQGTFVDDGEIRSLVKKACAGAEQSFCEELVSIQSGLTDADSGERDPLFDEAVEIVLSTRRGSVSLLQRRLQVGYSRASRIVDQMAQAGILGDHKGSQARECLISIEDWNALRESIQADLSGASAVDGTPTSA